MSSKRPRSESEQRFYAAWKLCQSLDQCGPWNTAESRRVYRVWRLAGRPAQVMAFIRGHTDAPSRRTP